MATNDNEKRYSVFLYLSEVVEVSMSMQHQTRKRYRLYVAEVPAGFEGWFKPISPATDPLQESRLLAYRLTEAEVLEMARKLETYGYNGISVSANPINLARVFNSLREGKFRRNDRWFFCLPDASAIRPKFREQYKLHGFVK